MNKGASLDLFPKTASIGMAADLSGVLSAWCPESWPVAPDWQPVLNRFFASPESQALAAFVRERLDAGAVVYPPQPLHALALTPLAQVRVVVLGQDPYHGPGQAQGLAFSVPSGSRLPPSLRNIFKEIANERATGALAPARTPGLAAGSLVHWARQGVLLLNTCLTVEQGMPASHARQGWEVLTDHIIEAVAHKGDPVVFMLWGAHAQSKRSLMQGGRHLTLQANHPSPLSALRAPLPFMGCGHFAQANAFLATHGHVGIDW